MQYAQTQFTKVDIQTPGKAIFITTSNTLKGSDRLCIVVELSMQYYGQIL